MEEKNKKEVAEYECNKRMVCALNDILKNSHASPALRALFGSYIEKEIPTQEFIRLLEEFASEGKLKEVAPLFDERLDADHIVNQEYGMLANLQPLFDEHHNLVGFIPSWVYKKE